VRPLALRLFPGETLPLRTVTHHTFVTAANVFREYQPIDMNYRQLVQITQPA